MEKVSFKTLRSGFHLSSRLCAFVLCVAVALSAMAAGTITIHNRDISLKEALAAVKQQAKVFVMYESGTIDPNRQLSLDLDNVSLQTAMDAICSKAGLHYEIKEQYVLVTRGNSGNSNAAAGRYTGRVTDESGEPLAGVSVVIGGKASGAITNADGYYSVNAKKGDTLKFRYIGAEPAEVVLGSNSTVNVALKNDYHMLQEVNVVSNGYQSLPKERATGSFASLSEAQLKKVPTPNLVQRMEGQVPGMKVSVYAGDRTFDYTNTLQSANSATRTMGAADFDMNIRGVSTLTGEKMPLIVVDGVISDFDISNIDPNNIENITVLKDAAAASIWGSRAANGVIVITTKKGEQGQRPSVSLSMTLTTQDKPDLGYLNQMTSAEVLDYEKEIVDRGFLYSSTPADYYSAQTYFTEGTRLALDLKNGKISQNDYDSRVAQLSALNNHKQISKFLLRRASSQQYNVAVNGGGNNSTYYYSVSYSQENPYAKGNSASRLNINLSNSWKLFNRATLTTNFAGSFFKYKDNSISMSEAISGSTITMTPYMMLADENGRGIDYDVLNPEWTSTLGPAYKPWTYNYLDELALNDNKQRTDNYSANLNLFIPIVFGISSSTTYALERGYTEAEQWYDPASYKMRNMMNYYTPIGATTNSLGIRNGGFFHQYSNNRNWTFRQQLNYDGVIAGIHRLNVLAGLELRETYIEQGSSTIWGYNRETGIEDGKIDMTYNSTYDCIAGYPTSFNGGGYPTGVNRKRRFLSYYANAGYTLLDRYYLSGSVRYDDYNNFGLDRKYRAKPFYSLGAKWNISREKFMEQTTWINNLALRVTYGINGNISQSAYPFTKLHLSSDWNTGLPTAGISSLANPQLRWEKTHSTNIGLDFSLFNHRLTGSMDYYWKRSRDLLYTFAISSSIVGNINNSSIERNAVSIDGKGFDLNLNGIVYQNRDWNVSLGANLAWNRNEVKENQFFTESQYASSINYSPEYVGYISGYATDKLFAFRYAGLNENGEPMVYNKDGEKVGPNETISSIDDLVNVGHKNPTVYGGFNLNVRWKNFTLYSLFTYQFGGHFFRPVLSQFKTSAYGKWTLSDDVADRWRQPGDELTTNVPGITSNYIAVGRYRNADVNVEKSDYLRWRQISLSYDFSPKLLSKAHINSANLAFTVSNLGLLWKANKAGFDPDYAYGLNSSNLPPEKAYSISLNINF